MKHILGISVGLVLAYTTPVQAKPLNMERIKTSVNLAEVKPDTIVVSTTERRLFYKAQDGSVIGFRVAVGRKGMDWSNKLSVTKMAEWPDWTPPAEMLQRRPDLPKFVKGGEEENPLGARALYLGSTLYRIHGSNEPETIGHAVSSGCFRMTNDDVVNLYDRVRVGTKVIVLK
jgi:lipoprotein-anchoring transpeptidase ErfK/SrfK